MERRVFLCIFDTSDCCKIVKVMHSSRPRSDSEEPESETGNATFLNIMGRKWVDGKFTGPVSSYTAEDS